MIVNSEFERMWNKTVVTDFKTQARIFLMELKKITKNLSGVSDTAKIRTGHLPSKSLKPYSVSQLARC
jgi:hypothetical protein